MLPETMFVMERVRHMQAVKGGARLADPLENWPSTRLERAALWFSRWVNGWEEFPRPDAVSGEAAAGELRLCKRV